MAYQGFKALEGKLANRPGVTNPGALAASIGRAKYGAQKFNHAAATGHSLKGKKPAGKSRNAALAAYMKQHGG